MLDFHSSELPKITCEVVIFFIYILIIHGIEVDKLWMQIKNTILKKELPNGYKNSTGVTGSFCVCKEYSIF